MNHFTVGPQISYYQHPPPAQHQPNQSHQNHPGKNSNSYENQRKIESEDLKSIANNLSGDLRPLCKELGIDEQYLTEWENMDQKEYSAGERMLFLWIQRKNEVHKLLQLF